MTTRDNATKSPFLACVSLLRACARLLPAAGLLFAITAQTPAQTPGPAVTTTSQAIFPLSQVHRGLMGVAYTVFEGTQPEPMQVEILGVLHDAIGPGQDMILARLRGEKPEYTGVVAGMSGSPVYIDGKLLGALSYRIGQFSKEPIAGITPIESMLELRSSKPGAQQSSTSSANSALPSQMGLPASASAPDMQPMETPLVFSGFSQQTISLFADRFNALGLRPIAGMASSLGSASPETKQPGPLVPGSAVSAVLVEGDLNISATCTVTYVDPQQMLACGHPITQYGNVSMPMTKAEVVATLASPLNSFKIINTTETIGTITQDRASAILGRFGQTAQMVPITINIRPDAKTELKPRSFHVQVLNNAHLTPAAVLVSVYQSLQGTNTSGDQLSYHLTGQLDIAGQTPVTLNTLIAPTEQLPSGIAAALYINQHFASLYDNTLEQPDVRGLTLNVDVVPERRSAQLESVRLSTLEAHPGDTVTLEATITPYHTAQRVIQIPFTLPQTLTPGPLRILVSDAATLDRVALPPLFLTQHTLPVAAEIAQLNRQHSNGSIYITLLDHNAQAILQSQSLPELPLSMANVMQPLRETREMSLTGESVHEAASFATGFQFTGSQVLTLEIR